MNITASAMNIVNMRLDDNFISARSVEQRYCGESRTAAGIYVGGEGRTPKV